MAASGAVMVEVGTTNRTRLADYQKAFTSNTGAILKAHQSNYSISGFTEEASIAELAKWSRTRGVPFIYDIGSGLLRKPEGVALEKEPDVAGAIAEGADLVTFSCDKLLGGPQAGVMVGRKELVQQLAKAPLMRALRVGKLTLAALGAACRHYLSNTTLQANPAFAMLEQTPGQLDSRASRLAELLARRGIDTEIVDSAARCGGGTLPDIEIPSRAVAIIAPRKSVREREAFARRAYHHLLRTARPILGVLREGQLLFDLFTISDSDLEWIAESIAESISTKENR
jgi:L-seryl-tRNA(Ser) seleniumtransferase